MIFAKIWERYIFIQLVKIFSLFVLGFFLLYTLMDYSLHASHFSKIADLKFYDFLLYYFYIFIKRLDLVLPLALLIATIKVFLTLNEKNELIALFIGGVKKTSLTKPPFILAILLSALLLINFEKYIPDSLTYLERFENQNFKTNTAQEYSKPSAYAFAVESGGKLFFSKYIEEKKLFEDVYYFLSPREFWKMKSLDISGEIPIGFFVDHLTADKNKLLVKENSFPKKTFPHLTIDFSARKKAALPFEHRSLSSLWLLLRDKSLVYQEHAPKIKTQLFNKIAISFSTFLVILGVIPFCLIFSRRLPIFMIYAISIFGLIAFFTLMDAAVILGENKVFPTYIAIIPMIFSLVLLGWNFIKMMKT